MSNFQDKVKKTVTALVNHMIEGDTYEWPPTCALFTYQPVRPYDNEAGEQTSVNE